MRASIKWKFCRRRREGDLCKTCRNFPARSHSFPAFPAAYIFSKKWKSFSVKFYLATKFAAVPAATKNPNFWKNGSDIVKFAAAPKIPNIGKFWKRIQKKERKRFPLPSILLIFLFLTLLPFFPFSFS